LADAEMNKLHQATAAAVLGWIVLYVAVSVTAEKNADAFVPSLWIVPLLVAGIYCALSLPNVIAVVIGLAWIAWIIPGSMCSVASYMTYGHMYYQELQLATLVHLTFSLVFILGMRTSLGNAKASSTPVVSTNILPITNVGLLLFPVVYIYSMSLAVGGLPILSGKSFVEDIYNRNYGPLHGYGILLVFSALHHVKLLRGNPTGIQRTLLILNLLLCVLCTFADGRRYFLFIAAFSIVIDAICNDDHLLRVQGFFAKFKKLVIVVFVGFFAYYIIHQIRASGGNSEGPTFALAGIIGVEFRDGAYVINNIDKINLTGYSYFESLIGSLINEKVLLLFGQDKAALVSQGLPFVLQDFFHSRFGIRTGVIVELYVAYGFIGLVGMYIIGLLTGKLCSSLAVGANAAFNMAKVILVALLAFSLMGQSTAIFGLFPTIGYFLIADQIALRVFSRVQR